MKISTKLVAAAMGAAFVATLAAIVTVYNVSYENRINELKSLMSSTLSQADKVTSNMDSLQTSYVYNQEVLLTDLAKHAGKYQNSLFYKTIPVVGGWETVGSAAKELKFELYTPTRPDLTARNPKNRLPEFDEAFKAFAAGQTEYTRRDDSTGTLIVARPVKLVAGCLSCHGDGKSSPTGDGKDLLGFKMENMKVGDIKGAFVLKAKMADDGVVQASVTKMAGVGLFVLLIVAGGFWWLNQKLIVGPLRNLANAFATASKNVETTSSEIVSSGEALSRGANAQAAAIEETSASTNELRSMTASNTQSVSTAADLMREASRSVDEANSALRLAVTSMDEINTSSRKISQIIKVIDEIAFQTNILALNAAVEAARAGEAGAGFAVVADEVRALAQRSAQAARETASLIEDSIEKAKQGTDRVKAVDEAINQTTAASERVMQLMEQVTSASMQQGDGIDQIARAITDMEKGTQSTAHTAEQNATAGGDLLASAKEVDRLVGELRFLVEGTKAETAKVAA